MPALRHRHHASRRLVDRSERNLPVSGQVTEVGWLAVVRRRPAGWRGRADTGHSQDADRTAGVDPLQTSAGIGGNAGPAAMRTYATR